MSTAQKREGQVPFCPSPVNIAMSYEEWDLLPYQAGSLLEGVYVDRLAANRKPRFAKARLPPCVHPAE